MSGSLSAGAAGAPWMALAAVILAAVLAAVEHRRRAPHGALRAALAAGAVLLLGAMAIRPVRSHAVPDGGTAVIATPDPETGAVPRETLRRALAVSDSLGGAPVVRRDTIPDLAWLRRSDPGITSLQVVGAGLPAADRRAARGLAVTVHPADLRGLVELGWTRTAALGETVAIAGRIAGADSGAWVHLDGGAGPVDSARTDARGRFAFATRPRATGRQLYLLRAASPEPTAAALGVSVVPARPPRVLILESAPSFETRHLKRWLAEQGSAVAVRSLVSRGVYRYEHLNRRSLPLAPLTLGALVQFDLVVTDGGTLRALTGAERAALRSVVADSGRGLLLLPDEIVVGGGRGIPDAGFFLAAPAAPVAGAEQRSVRLAGGGPARAIPAAAARIGERFAAAAVLHDADGSPVAAVAPRGAGRVALTLVREPGRWLLAGDTESFAGYWSRLLTPLAAGVSRERWEVVQAHPLRVDEPVELVLTTAPRPVGAPAPHPAAFVTAPDGGRDSLHLIADPFDPARYRTTWWPRLDGWHRIESEGAALDVHVTAAGGGGTLMAAERLAATRRAAVMRRDDAAAPAAARAAIRPLSPLPLFLAFVAVTGALWVLDRRGPRHGGAGGMPPSGAVTAG